MDQEQNRQESDSQLDFWAAGEEEDAVQLSPKPRRNRFLMAVGALALVVLLGAAAYEGSKMLAGPAPVEGSGPQLMLSRSDGAGATVKTAKLERASELPEMAPDVGGMVVERADNSLTVASNTGGAVFAVKKSGGNPGPDAGTESKLGPDSLPAGVADGPKVEVVVTRETKVYRDVTEFSLDQAADSSTVQQEVELATVEDIPDDSFVSVWGEKRGDRLTADVILFH